ncbi:MAG TPA: hypothetical protein VJG83_01355 [archaeon]|nr:hypothetical protein [archaeon]
MHIGKKITNGPNVAVAAVMLIAIIAISGCNFKAGQSLQGNSADGFLAFEDTDYGIKMKYPSTWTKQMVGENGIVVLFISPQENDSDTFTESLNISIQYLGNEPVKIQDYTTSSFVDIASGLPDIATIEGTSVEIPGISGLVANKIIYTATIDGEKMQAINVWIVDSENYGHQITFLSEQKNFDKYIGIVDEMIKSYEITKTSIRQIPFKAPKEEIVQGEDISSGQNTAPGQEQISNSAGQTDIEGDAPVADSQNALELSDPTALLPGKWRAYSKYAYYDAGGSSAMETSSIILLYLNADRSWIYGTGSGNWSVEEITASDWPRWGIEPYNAKYKITLQGWNGASADGPIDQTATGVNFLWAIYDADSQELTAPGQIQMKFGHVPN